VAGTDIAGLTVGQRLPVGAFPDGVTVDAAGRLWVASTFGYSVSRVDPVTGLQDVVPFPDDSDPLAITALPEGIFVTLRNSDVVARIDPETFVHQTVAVTDSPTFLAWGAGSLWSVGSTGIDRIDPATLQVTATVAIQGSAGVAVTSDAAWATQRGAGTLARIDLATNEVVATYPVGTGPDAIATDGEALWIANRDEGTVVRFDLATQQVTARIPIGTAPSGVAIDGDRVWVTDVDGGSLVLIDRLSATPVSTVPVGGRPLGLQPIDDTVWVTLSTEHTLAAVRVLDDAAAARPAAAIAEITSENGRFVPRYTWDNFTPELGGLHVHFYWNTVPIAQAAAPGSGPWLAWDQPDRVEEDFFAATNRPAGATSICVVIVDAASEFADVDADGVRDYDTGNCAPLPAQ
jgi:YVTN family beta-propeller protein